MTNRVGQQLGNYHLIRLLGQGGFAEVYLGEHLHLETKAAVKVLDGKLTAQDVQTFTKEARIIATLKHPHILRVLDFGFEATIPFLVMEFATQGTLRDRHPRGSVVPPPRVISYVKPIAAALHHAHTQKIIHRDVKPENILVDDQQTLLLSDFGIAAMAHNTSSMKTVDNSGTPHYMAPEQFQGKPCEASDQYALAIMVYEWLTGQRPFRGDSFFAIGMQHLSTPVPSLRKKNRAISPEIEQAVFQALAKDPKERFLTIQDFAAALEQAMTIRGNSSTYINQNPFDQQKVSLQPKKEPRPTYPNQPASPSLIASESIPEPLVASSIRKASQLLPTRTAERREPSTPTGTKTPPLPPPGRGQRTLRAKRVRKNLFLTLVGCILTLLVLVFASFLLPLFHFGSSSSESVFLLDATVGHEDTQAKPSHFFALNLHGTAVVVESLGRNPTNSRIYIGPKNIGDNTPVTVGFQDVTGDHLPDMIMYVGQSPSIWVNEGTQFRPSQNGEVKNTTTLPGPVSSNVHYPIFQTDAAVGHHGDSSAHPSFFLAINLHGEILIVEFPAGDPTYARIYVASTTANEGDLVALGFRDVTGDHKIDMIVSIKQTNQTKTVVFVNDSNFDKFRLATNSDKINL